MRVLITGITGSLGQAVTEKLLNEYPDVEIIGVSRDEQKQRSMKKHPRLTLKIGDVRDFQVIGYPNVICHFAALKCVDTVEDNVAEAIRTNVGGTAMVAGNAQRYKAKVVFTSTDKAVYPINAYGMTKGLGEKIVLQERRNAVCRYGNVLGSRGSVLNHFVKSLLEERVVRITNPKMTRFWVTLEEAADFVIDHIFQDTKTGLNIIPCKAAGIMAIAKACAQILRVRDYDIQTIGIRPGEKLHEDLSEDLRSNDPAIQYEPCELIELLRPMVERIKAQCEKS